MNVSHLSERLPWIATTIVAVLAAGPRAFAQSDAPSPRQSALEQHRAATSRDVVHVVLEGSVLAPDGAPALGAVVVSSAGGQALAGAGGEYRLEIAVSPDAQRVQVTAVGRGREDLLASRSVALPSVKGLQGLEPLVLAVSSGCSPSWIPTFGAAPGTNDEIRALIAHDDGSGPALFAAGVFSYAGSGLVNGVARWDGSTWAALGTGMGPGSFEVNALAVFDDGGGDALFAGGRFSTAGGASAEALAKWDGAAWTALGAGTSGTVNALAVFDDGGGPELYAGGSFATIGGLAASKIARWNGTSWSALGSGIVGTSRSVKTLAVFDDGGGEALYAGGDFTIAGGVSASRVAKWDGSSWSALGSGISASLGNISVNALAVYDDGGGAALYVGGDFTIAGGLAASNIAKWDGASWSALGAGITGSFSEVAVNCLAVFDGGSGLALHVGGFFDAAGGTAAPDAAKWNGTSWSPLGIGLNRVGLAFAVFDDGGGAALYAGGAFTRAGMRSSMRIAKWSGSNWRPLGTGIDQTIQDLEVFDDGGGPALYAGGELTTAGGVSLGYVGKWDGTSWTPLGLGTDQKILALEVFDDGGGEALYAGGAFTIAGGVSANYIARWDGSSWSGLGGGTSSWVWDLAVFDDGGGEALYAGGLFTTAGGVPVNRVAKWDGSSWSDLAGGMSTTGFGPAVRGLATFDDGSGMALYAAGEFETAGGVAANNIAKWDGTTWSPLASGLRGFSLTQVYVLAEFDDGSGPGLFAGGNFNEADGMPALKIAKWDGSVWSSVGGGTNNNVFALTVFDDGGGPALYAAGAFTAAGAVSANGVARWDGVSWQPLGSGVSDFAYALGEFDDGNGPALYVGGRFASVPESGDSFLGKWACAETPSLSSDVLSISLGTGGQQPLDLDGGPACAGWFYFMFGSVTGTDPGLDFGGGVVLPLIFDAYFALTLNKPGLGAFGNFRGTLDGAGQAQATLTLPALGDPSLVGVVLRHAYLAGSVFGVPEFASVPTSLTLVP